MPPSKFVGNNRLFPPNREKTEFVIDFKMGQETLTKINGLMKGSKHVQSQLIMIALGILKNVEVSSFELYDRLTLMEVTVNSCETEFEQFEDVQCKIVKFVDHFLSHCKPVTKKLNRYLIDSFFQFFNQLDVEEQIPLFEKLGMIVNPVLYQQSLSFPSVKDLDLQTLLKWSADSVYDDTDNRLKMFLEAATKVSKKQIESLNENTKVTKKYSLYNCIENLLKARNRKCVAPPGLSLMSLAYIFGGRSRFICQLLSSTGAKGTYPLIKDIILKNSEESSLKKCHDGIEVYYSFDNVQKFFAIHRL